MAEIAPVEVDTAEPATVADVPSSVSIAAPAEPSAIAAPPAATTGIMTTTDANSTESEGYLSWKLRKRQSVAELNRLDAAFHAQFGLDVTKRRNISFIEDMRIVYAAGNVVVFQDIVTKHREYLMGIDEAGVGSVGVHPSRKFLAVGGNGHNSKIYIYSYPQLKIMKILADGAERGYASLSFSASGLKLASVSTAPDFLLTVWDWEEEKIGLHSKAFGQDVFSVRFSLDDERRLTTSGTGHIRFWKMAATFTGLKLQGHIGKFGKVELSDVASFCELPDGKVLSGTEVGSLLLWEGNFIKCRFTAVGGALCHTGEVTYIDYDKAENVVITCAKDGVIRWWDFDAIDTAEVDTDISMDFELFPLAEYSIATPYNEGSVGIHTLLDSGLLGEIPAPPEEGMVAMPDEALENPPRRNFVVLDTEGNLQVITFELKQKYHCKLLETVQYMNLENINSFGCVGSAEFVTHRVIGEYHSGMITAMDTSPCAHLCATAGKDGTVRCWNYAAREMLGVASNDKAVTSLRWVPIALDPTARSFVAGFADGVVRLYTLIGVNNEESAGKKTTMLSRKMVFKPHNAEVSDIHFSLDGTRMASTGKDGIVFFFKCSGVDHHKPWEPLRFVSVSKLYNNLDMDGALIEGAESSPEGMAALAQTGVTRTCDRLQWCHSIETPFLVLLTCSDGVVRELDTSVFLADANEAPHPEEVHSFECTEFACREAPVSLPFSSIQREMNATSILNAALAPAVAKTAADAKTTDAKAGGEDKGVDDKEEKEKKNSSKDKAPAMEFPKQVNAKVAQALYQYNSKAEVLGNVYLAASTAVNLVPNSSAQTHFPMLLNFTWGDAEGADAKVYKLGLYTHDGKEALKQPSVSCMNYSKQKTFICTGASDGSISVRPATFPETFVRLPVHYQAVTATAFAFDDTYVLSVGVDGVLNVYRLRPNALTDLALDLGRNLEANVFGTAAVKEQSLTQLKDIGEVPFVNYVECARDTDAALEEHFQYPNYDRYVNYAVLQPLDLERADVADYVHLPPAVEPTTTTATTPAPTTAEEAAVVTEQGWGEGKSAADVSVAETEIATAAIVEASTGAAAATDSALSNAPAALATEDADATAAPQEESEAIATTETAAKAVPKASRTKSPPPPKVCEFKLDEVSDIQENAYSIQDAKLKLEEDAKRVEAEAKKDDIRATIRGLQEEYEFILQANNELPTEVRVEEDLMVVDHQYFRSLREEGERMVEETHKECAYETEKAEKLRRKLITRLMSGLLVEEMPLYGFGKKPTTVLSLRTRGTDADLREILNSVHAQVRAEELEEAKSKATSAAQKNASVAMEEMYGRMQKKENETSKKITGDGQGHKQTSASARREFRRIRKKELAEHAARKPNENEDDPRDIKAIQHAEQTIGNYRLKVADDYEVPESQRTNVQKKRKQMAMLEESMVSMRLRFNERFLAMRELKRQMVYTICKDNERIRAIDEELLSRDKQRVSQDDPVRGVDGQIVVDPFLTAVEFPDDRDEVTHAELEQFTTARNNAIWKDAHAPTNEIFTGAKTVIATNYHTGRYVAEQKDVQLLQFNNQFDEPESFIPFIPEEPKPYGVNDLVLANFTAMQDSTLVKQMSMLDKFVPVLNMARTAKQTMIQKTGSARTAQTKEARRRSLLFERKQLIKKTNDNITGFEEALDELRMDRHTIASDLKLAELKLLVLFQEFKLLETFETRDMALQQKQQRCLKEKAEISTNVTECQGKLQAKQEEFKLNEDKVNGLTADFKAQVPDSHAHCEILTKIFKKKVKRAKKGLDDDDDEYEESEDEEDDDDDDDDDEIEDGCPPGVDLGIYEHVIDIREKRADYEDFCADIQKGMDEFKKTIERMRQREKQIDKESRQTEAEIQNFQLQKQAALNTIDIVVPLSISQLYVFEYSGMFTGPTQAESATDATVPADGKSGFATANPNGVTTADGSAGEGEKKTDNDSTVDGGLILRDASARTVVSAIDLKSYVLFSEKALKQLQQRIGELITETHEAKTQFKELHKERVKLERERDVVKNSIDGLTTKCSTLQMLKFGKVMDIDQLEAGNDKTKEKEAQQGVEAVEEKHAKDVAALTRELDALRDDLAKTTKKSTMLLREVSELTEVKQAVCKDLNASSGVVVAQDSKSTQFKEIEERKRIAQYVTLQSREIEALKMELIMLKRKEAPQMMPYAAPPSNASMMSQTMPNPATNSTILPPINHRR